MAETTTIDGSAGMQIGCEARLEEVVGGFRTVLTFWPGTAFEQSFPSIVFADRGECERASRGVALWLQDNW